MNNRFVWLVKNSRIYKAIRAAFLSLSNSLEQQVTPAFLFLSQHKEGKFNRYDVVVRYMAIEDLHGGGNSGLLLYHKMQLARNQFLVDENIEIKNEDLHHNREGSLLKLVESMQSKGFNADFPLVVNPRLGLVDGSHRLACALYLKVKLVLVKKSEPSEIDYGLDWFKQYFEQDELNKIQEKYQEIVKSIGIGPVLNEILTSEKQVFGRGAFYQSCEELGISGQRPTAKRYHIYRLDEHLTSEHSVLDIGCNCGFFTLLIAKKVKSAMGVEITQTLVDIAQMTQVYLNRQNVKFLQGNFNSISLEAKFDFICSFAVHHWLGADMKKYGKRLQGLLNPGGKVLLESQNIQDQDQDWEEKVKDFCEAGFEEVSNGFLKDDDVIERRFAVLLKIDSVG